LVLDLLQLVDQFGSLIGGEAARGLALVEAQRSASVLEVGMPGVLKQPEELRYLAM